MALGTLATVALVASAAAGVNQAVDARKNRKDQEARLKAQEEKARAEAGLEQTRDETGAEVELGTQDDDKRTTTSTAGRRRTRVGRSALSSVGGLTSSRVGL